MECPFTPHLFHAQTLHLASFSDSHFSTFHFVNFHGMPVHSSPLPRSNFTSFFRLTLFNFSLCDFLENACSLFISSTHFTLSSMLCVASFWISDSHCSTFLLFFLQLLLNARSLFTFSPATSLLYVSAFLLSLFQLVLFHSFNLCEISVHSSALSCLN